MIMMGFQKQVFFSSLEKIDDKTVLCYLWNL